MSKEFEEIVLKKLDILETEVKGNNQRLTNLETEVKDNNQRLANLETEVKCNTKKIFNLEAEVKDTKQGVKDLATKLENSNQRLGKLEIEVKDTQEVVKYLNQNFTKFDHEINKKIDTLFDSYTASKEKYSVHEENIISLDAKIFNHDVRISNLENKILTV